MVVDTKLSSLKHEKFGLTFSIYVKYHQSWLLIPNYLLLNMKI